MGKQSWTTVQQNVSRQKKNGKEVLLEVHRCVGYAGHGVDDFEERVQEFEMHGYPYIIYAHPNPADLNAVQAWEHKHRETLARLKSEGKYAHIAERRQQPDWIEAYKKYLQFLQSTEGENARFLLKSVAKNFVLRILKKEESTDNGKELQETVKSKGLELQEQIEKLAEQAFAQMIPDLSNKNESSENPVLHALEETVDCISALVPDKDHPAYAEDKTKVFKIVVSLDGFGGSVDHAFKFAQKLNYVLDSAVPINLAPSPNAQLANGPESRKDKKHEKEFRKKKIEVAKKELTIPQDQVSGKEQNLDGNHIQTATKDEQHDNSTNKKVHTMHRKLTQQETQHETTSNDDAKDKNEKDPRKDSSAPTSNLPEVKTSDKEMQMSGSEQPSQQVISSSNLPQAVKNSDKKELRSEQQPSQQYFTASTHAFLISSMDIDYLEQRIIQSVCEKSLEEANGIVKGKENSVETLKELQQLSEVNGIVLGGILRGFRSRFDKSGTSSMGIFGTGKTNLPPANMPNMSDMQQERPSTPKTDHISPRQKVYG